ncbi:hypothetical protein HER10_EVM0012216 [Colletotrichum scovillei]|uniref:uncharacterized protein n=1 Tax=Colletotrichum scovillei TaxID=1209932 RepID=UPI0015C35C05|nr:uncharacterized protein HER10_EVM0012216 [Colletotrichum scovillei]KAF4774374.1 hypothetical protein HER10_EVM0012216 [Colletotrichum scovillei]
MDRVKQFLAVKILGRITGPKKAKPEHDTDVDVKDNTKVESKADPRTRYHDFATQTPPGPKPPRPNKKGWNFRREAEFPWRIEQLVDQEENWRGTWVLEVKDMRALEWNTEFVPKSDRKGKGGRYRRQPTRHFPFPIDGDRNGNRETLGGGQDDLMIMLGKS